LPAVGAALLGTVVVIWFALATVEARRIAFPTFYSRPRLGAASPKTTEEPADPRSACGADFEAVTLSRRDGFKLAAWFVPASKPAAVILLHGAGSNRHEMLWFLKFLHPAGYPAMILDEIDHGNSDDTGLGVGYGWREREDVLSAVAALRARGYSKIGALGVSQGAAAAFFAQSQDRNAMRAIVADSSYADLGRMLRRLPSIANLNPAFARTIIWESRYWLGRSADEIAPASAAGDLGECALMVIQGNADALVPVADARTIYAAARAYKEIWIVAHAGHGMALSVQPDEYARRVISFFDRHLLGTQ
jgi:pimeloyl-ACP methyl ester carboxylesterase